MKEIWNIFDNINNNDNSNNEIEEEIDIKLNNDINNDNNKKYNALDEKKIRINLGLNQCLYEKGKLSEALQRSEHLVNLLNDDLNINRSSAHSNDNLFILNNKEENNISVEEVEEKIKEYHDLSKLNDKLKSKIYGNYAIYKQSFHYFENYNNKLKQLEKKEINFNISVRRTMVMNTTNLALNKSSAKNLEYCHPLLKEEKKRRQELKENLNNLIDKDLVSDINNNFILATRYNNTNFNLWHSYAMFNYKLYKSLLNLKNKEKFNENNYAINAVEGFKYSIIIGRKKNKNIFQDLLRLIDIFFDSSSNNKELINLINTSFNEIEVDSFLIVLPQLLCRFNLKDTNILSILITLLIKIGKTYPRAIISNLIVMKCSNSKKRISMAKKILKAIINNSDINKKISWRKWNVY